MTMRQDESTAGPLMDYQANPLNETHRAIVAFADACGRCPYRCTLGAGHAAVSRPLAQAAAWAIMDRVIDGKMTTLVPAADFTRTQRGTIAAPLLAAGMLGGVERRSLLTQLERDGEVEQRELVVVAAAAAGRTEGLQIGDGERLIGEVVAHGSTAGLDASGLDELDTWSRSLDVGGEFSRYAAWVAHDLLGLPLSADLGDVRDPDLPNGMPVMTMRSLTPYREKPGLKD